MTMRGLYRETRGSAAAEFAAVVPLLFLLTVGMLGLVSQTVNRARLDRAAATGVITYVEAVNTAGGAENIPGHLPTAANGIGLCASLADHTGLELERASGCPPPPPSATTPDAVEGEAVVTVWAESLVGVRPFRMTARSIWRAVLPR